MPLKMRNRKCIRCGWTGFDHETLRLSSDELNELEFLAYRFLFIGRPARLNYFYEWVKDGAHICPICESRMVLNLLVHGDHSFMYKVIKDPNISKIIKK
jgi:hypothetical protein